MVHPYTSKGKLERVVNKEIQPISNFNGQSMPVQVRLSTLNPKP